MSDRKPYRLIGAQWNSDILLVADHASNHVPEDIDLGVDPAILDEHVAIDIGAGPVTELLSNSLQAPALLAEISRLVIDLHREEHVPALVPVSSDGHSVPGNRDIDIAARIARFHRPYHDKLAALVAERKPALMVAIHSFTPSLRTAPAAARPWDIGLLYNEDRRASAIAIPLLEEQGLVVGDQEPYSGKLLNATMNRHAEANGIPYLVFEMRQDLVATPAGQARFADILDPLIRTCRNRLA